MGLEGGVYLYHKMTPPPNLGHFWVVFEGLSQIFAINKVAMDLSKAVPPSPRSLARR